MSDLARVDAVLAARSDDGADEARAHVSRGALEALRAMLADDLARTQRGG